MSEYDGVLLDWSGTLVVDPQPADRLRWALRRLGRTPDDGTVLGLLHRLKRAALAPQVAEALRDHACDADRHRFGELFWYDRAGLDADLAAELYGFDGDPMNRPLFPDVLDVLTRLRAAGLRTVVVSDTHLDLRPLLGFHGAGDLIDGYVLSFEHGRQKPEPDLFWAALRELRARPERTLMVGDRPGKDGGATAIGITTLILPHRLAHRNRPRLTPLLALTR
nr:HAD family hydrolase [Micromonospora sp. DSM 115978]